VHVSGVACEVVSIPCGGPLNEGKVLQRYQDQYAPRARGVRRKADDADSEQPVVMLEPEP